MGFFFRVKDRRESLFLEGIGRGSRVLLCDPLEFFFVFFLRLCALLVTMILLLILNEIFCS